MAPRPYARMLFVATTVLVIALLDDWSGSLRFLIGTRGWWETTGYAALYAATLAAVFMLWSSRGLVRHMAYHISAASLAISAATRAINHAGFGLEEARIALYEHSFAREAFLSFPLTLLGGAAVGAAAGAAIYTAGNRLLPRAVPPAVALPLAAAVLLPALLPRLVSFTPGPARVPNVLLAAALHKAPAPQNVAPAPEGNRRSKHIVLVVDESIRADVFTPPGIPQLIDFGTAVSATNCSASSNFALRTGVDTFPLRGPAGPSIFARARAAGFRTILIDGQSRSQAPRNLMSERELASLDEHLVIRTLDPSIRPGQVDAMVAKALAARLRAEQPSFILVNKYGAHFHYETVYPSGASLFRPNLAEREAMRHRLRTRNSYRNAVAWSTDQFFGTLGPLPPDTVLIYTSDHGQSLPGEGARYPHCVTGGAPSQQGAVPLLVIGDLPELRRSVAQHRHRASHAAIHPTLLWLMGYQAHHDLREPRYRPHFFTGDIFGRGRFATVSTVSEPSGQAHSERARLDRMEVQVFHSGRRFAR